MASLPVRSAVLGCRERGLGFLQNHKHQHQRQHHETWNRILCSLRNKGKARKPLGRAGRIMSTEAIQAIQALKRAHKHNQIDQVYTTKLSRLLKADLLAVLAELHRQNEFKLALQIFDLVRKELWYKPDLYLYADMILMVGRNKLIDQAELLFSQMKEEGLEPNTRVCTELLCAYTEAGMIEKAMEIYEMMKTQSGCKPNELTFTILISSLERVEEKDLASIVRRDAVEYLNYPTKYLESFTDKQIPVKCFPLILVLLSHLVVLS